MWLSERSRSSSGELSEQESEAFIRENTEEVWPAFGKEKSWVGEKEEGQVEKVVCVKKGQ